MDGRLDFQSKGTPGSDDSELIPWYRTEGRRNQSSRILFGHWASLSVADNEDFNAANVFPLDMGCVWGRELAALRLEDARYFKVASRQV